MKWKDKGYHLITPKVICIKYIYKNDDEKDRCQKWQDQIPSFAHESDIYDGHGIWYGSTDKYEGPRNESIPSWEWFIIEIRYVLYILFDMYFLYDFILYEN